MKLCKDCKNRGSKRECQFHNSCSNYAERCKDFELPKPSNADCIRAMSDEELAEWIHNIVTYQKRNTPMISVIVPGGECEKEIHDSYGDLLEWLQGERKE